MAMRTAVITGGMGGLGDSISTKMHAAGYRVAVTHSPNNTKVKQWLTEHKAADREFTAFAVDVTDFDSCKECIGRITKEIGPVDILVNNAGITRDTTFKKMTKTDWDAVIRTNLDSVFNMTKQVTDGMVDRSWGRVINVSSVNGSKGAFGQTNYSAAKAGMHGFTKALALEVAQGGDGEHHFARLYRHQDGNSDPAGDPRLENPAANSPWSLGKARGNRRPHHLSLLGRGSVRHRRQYRHQRWTAHAMISEKVNARTYSDGDAKDRSR
jgi:acetoacetyl-CoA reductase